MIQTRKRESMLALMSLLLLLGVASQQPQFLHPGSLAAMLNDTSIMLILACGQMLVLLTRGIDLSAGANVALTGMCTALINQAWPGLGMLPLITIAVLLGAALGAFNGALVWKLNVPPIVATLGTMSIYRGLAYVISGGAWINSSQMSPAFLQFTRQEFIGLSMLSWLAIATVTASAWLLRNTPGGRNLYAAGDNPGAAAYAGIDPGRMQFLAFSLCGAFAGLCGYLWVSRFAVAYTDIALGFELQVIAACVIGGVSIAGGRGSVVGLCLGCLFLGLINNALPVLGISPFWQMTISGIIIVSAVIANARNEQPARRGILEGRSR
jgi:rhamnose transport system permease protein